MTRRKKDKDFELANYHDKTKNVYNAVGAYRTAHGSNIKFVRDPEALLHQYRNLVYSIGKKYSVFFTDYQERRDLFMYVKDTFISLVYEYDIDSNVDFQGYIKKMLEQRVRESYSKREKKRRDHIAPMKDKSNSVINKLDYNQAMGENANYLYRGEYTKGNRNKEDEDKNIEIKIGGILRDNDQDLFMFELLDFLESNHKVTLPQLRLLELLYKYQVKPKEAKDTVMNEYNIDIVSVNLEYEKLKNNIMLFIRK